MSGKNKNMHRKLDQDISLRTHAYIFYFPREVVKIKIILEQAKL